MSIIARFLRLGSIIGALPNNIVNGTVEDATQVMGNFNWIVNQVNANATAGAGTVTRNIAYNGAMQVSQRFGTTSANCPGGVKIYALDRWQISAGAGSSADIKQFSSTGLNEFQFAQRIQRTAANAATTTIQAAQSLESIDSYQMQNQTVTLSFWCRAGANYSATGNALVGTVYTGTGTDENVLTGYTGSAASVTQTFNLTNNWARYSVSGTIPAATTEVGIVFTMTPTGTAGANDYFDITGVQLEIGPSMSNFDFRPYQEMFARCLRYYQNSFPPGTVPATGVGPGRVFVFANKANPSANWFIYPLLGPLRAVVSATIYNPVSNNGQIRNETTGSDFTGTSSTVWNTFGLLTGTNPASTAVGDICTFQWTADAEL